MNTNSFNQSNSSSSSSSEPESLEETSNIVNSSILITDDTVEINSQQEVLFSNSQDSIDEEIKQEQALVVEELSLDVSPESQLVMDEMPVEEETTETQVVLPLLNDTEINEDIVEEANGARIL